MQESGNVPSVPEFVPEFVLFVFVIASIGHFGSAQEPRTKDGDGGSALAASINGPGGIAIDGNGNLLVVERNGLRIRKINVRTGIINTAAGNGKRCCFEESKPANFSSLHYPISIAVDAHQNVYLADTVARIQRVDAKTGLMTTIVRERLTSHGFDPGDAPSFADSEQIEGLAINSDGVLYAVGGLGHIYRINDTSITIVPVVDRSVSVLNPQVVPFTDPVGLAIGSDGTLFIADYQNCRIRRVEAGSNVISTISGNGSCKSSGDGGLAISATVDHPVAVAVDAQDNVYFADRSPSCVRRIDGKTSEIRSVPRTCEVKPGYEGGPSGLALHSQGNLYFTLCGSNLVRRVDKLT